MFDHKLLLMTDFDPFKTLDEYEFYQIPVWIRVSKLPLGLMNRTTAEIIAGEVGKFIDVMTDANGESAVGPYLRIKIQIDIRKPIWRGITLDVGDKKLWCPFAYEYLPDFCYLCGILDHIDTDCPTKDGTYREKQFGPWLRIQRKGRDDESKKMASSKVFPFWGRNRTENDGSWRKNDNSKSPDENQKKQVGGKHVDNKVESNLGEMMKEGGTKEKDAVDLANQGDILKDISEINNNLKMDQKVASKDKGNCNVPIVKEVPRKQEKVDVNKKGDKLRGTFKRFKQKIRGSELSKPLSGNRKRSMEESEKGYRK